MARAAGSIGSQPSRGGSAIGLGLTVLAGAVFAVVIHPAAGLPLAGAALAALVLSRRSPVAVMATVLAAGLAAFLADRFQLFVVGVPLIGVPLTARVPYVYGALMLALFVLVGPVTVALMRRRSALETVMILAASMLGLQVAALSAFAEGAGQSTAAYVSAAMQSVGSQLGVTQDLAKTLVSMWPAAMASAAGVVALFVVIGVGWASARQGVLLNRMPALAELDLDPRAALVPILAIALLALGKMQGDGARLTLIGENVLVIASTMFFLQGLAVFAGLYRKAKVPRMLRAFGFLLLFITESIAPVVSLTGLADVWLNIRRLPRKGQEQGEPKVTPGVD